MPCPSASMYTEIVKPSIIILILSKTKLIINQCGRWIKLHVYMYERKYVYLHIYACIYVCIYLGWVSPKESNPNPVMQQTSWIFTNEKN